MLVVLKGQKALQKGFGGRQVPPTLSNRSISTHPLPTPKVSSPGRFVLRRTSVLGKETIDI